MIAPSLEEISSEFAGKVKVAKLNIDENPELAAQYRRALDPDARRCSRSGEVADIKVGAAEGRHCTRRGPPRPPILRIPAWLSASSASDCQAFNASCGRSLVSPAACRCRREHHRRDRANRRSGYAAATRVFLDDGDDGFAAPRRPKTPAPAIEAGVAGGVCARSDRIDHRVGSADRHGEDPFGEPAEGARNSRPGSLVLIMPVTRNSGRGLALLEARHRFGDHLAGAGIVPAVDPDLRRCPARPRPSLPAGKPLQARRATRPRPWPRSTTGSVTGKAGRLDGTDRRRGIGILVPARQPRQRQVRQGRTRPDRPCRPNSSWARKSWP